jgi:hypothetical protein
MKISLDGPTSYVMLRFDDEATNYIQDIKDRMQRRYKTNPIGSNPHFTFTDWDGDRDDLFQKLSFFAETVNQFQFTFWSVGHFYRSGTLFLQPKAEHVFTALQYHLVNALGKPKSQYLEPGLWQPHCTVVKGLRTRQVNDARLQLLADFDVRDAMAVGFEISTKGQVPLYVELNK